MIDENKFRQILATLIEVNSLRRALELHGISRQVFHAAIAQVPNFAQEYMSAQAAVAEDLAEEIIEIADTEEDAQKARNRIDARRWYAGKIKPHKFGDRIDIQVTQVVDLKSAIDEAINRARPVRDLTESSQVQSIESTIKSRRTATDSESVEAPDSKECAVDEVENIFD